MVVAPRTEATTAQFQRVINTVFEIIAPVGVAVYSTETFITRCSYIWFRMSSMASCIVRYQTLCLVH